MRRGCSAGLRPAGSVGILPPGTCSPTRFPRSGREVGRRLDLPLANLAPEDDAARQAYFAALEAADRLDWQPLVAIWQGRFASSAGD